MVFWIVAASLTLAACLVVLLPAVRRQPELTHDNEHDLAVYNDQLQELEKDVARGVINASEAAEARSEIGRRILKLSSQKQDESHSTQLGKVITTVAVLSIPLASWGSMQRRVLHICQPSLCRLDWTRILQTTHLMN